MSSIFKEVTNKSKEYAKDFETLGENLIEGLKVGMEGKKPVAVRSITSVMNDIITAAQKVPEVKSPSKVFAEIGGWCTLGLAKGLTSETKAAVKATTIVGEAMEEGIRNTLGVHSLSDKWKGITEWAGKSLGVGLKSTTGFVVNTAKDLGIDMTSSTISGAVEGLAGGESVLTNKLKELLGIFTPEAATTGTEAGEATVENYQNAM